MEDISFNSFDGTGNTVVLDVIFSASAFNAGVAWDVVLTDVGEAGFIDNTLSLGEVKEGGNSTTIAFFSDLVILAGEVVLSAQSDVLTSSLAESVGYGTCGGNSER